MIQEVLDFLHSAPAFFVATADGSSPRVRPFSLVFEYNGMLCFGTSNQKAVYRQLQTNPRCEISALTPSGEWIRVTGKVMFLTDRRAKEAVFQAMPALATIYTDADNPVLQVFALTEVEATIYSTTQEGAPSQRVIDL